MKKRTIIVLASLLSGAQLSGCGQQLRRQALENVAKDWCLTIRASQVIPVYPLTEDLVPGDVFLVQMPLSTQVEIYDKRGFLPLDRLVTRLDGLEYAEFYKDAYWKGDYATTPHSRARRDPGGSVDTFYDEVEKAPRAAFPSYGFEVRSGAGLNLAIPVQSVPVGIGLMQADNVTGSITISDAFTYAIASEDLIARLDDWAAKPDVRSKLAELARVNEQPLYLRVVNRVYLTGAVVATLVNQDQRSASIDAGEPKAVELPTVTDSTTAAAYEETTRRLSEAISAGLPGASLRIAQVSRRSVTMSEAFDAPLVIGFLGFDVPILRDGFLGAPVATQDRLRRAVSDVPQATIGRLTEPERQYQFRILELKSLPSSTQMTVIEHVAHLLRREDDFEDLSDQAAAARASGSAAEQAAVLESFVIAGQDFVSLDGGAGPRITMATSLLDQAFSELTHE